MATDRRRTLRFTAPETVEIADGDVPEPSAGEVRVRTLVSAVSPGTELLVYRGEADRELSADAAIDALEGSLEFPLSYGYAAVGEVAALGEGVPERWRGRTVFAFHPHDSHFLATPAELEPVPPECDREAAALLPNVETAVNFLMDGAPVVGERVGVFGQGVVGLLTTALLSRYPLERVTAVEPRAQRRALAREYGADATVDPTDTDVGATVREHGTSPPENAGPEVDGGLDVAYELSGNPAALDDALGAVGYGGRVIVGSWYGRKRADLALDGRFHRSQLRVRASQVSTIDPEYRGRWDKDRRLETAWRRLAALDVDPLITDRVPIEDAADAYRRLNDRPDECLCALLTY